MFKDLGTLPGREQGFSIVSDENGGFHSVAYEMLTNKLENVAQRPVTLFVLNTVRLSV